MARFYLDENISRDAEHLLTRYGHDALHSVDLGHRAMPDPQHLFAAADDNRILLTFNRRDFELLHQFWTSLNAWGNLDRPHSGILTAVGEINDLQWANLVHAFVRQRQNLDNQMWEWRRQQQEWRRFSW